METDDTNPAAAQPCCSAARTARIALPAQAIARPAGEHERASVALPGATFLMGTNDADANSADGEGPVRPVSLSPFEIDTYPVTNADFAAFVQASGYVTDAERYGTSFVFQGQIAPERHAELVDDTVAAAPWWCLVRGAYWRAPAGPGSGIGARMDHPVVQVSWNDAAAFAAWSGTRLPTEAEWEYAARGGLVQKRYPWGDELKPGGRDLCNIWQGDFPAHSSRDDGFDASCPVDAYAPNGYALYSMTGNTWEWCADFWGTRFDSALAHDPHGPPDGIGRVMKGGSFLCHASYCNRYRPAARTHNTPDSAASHIGFRCARPAA